MKNIFKVGLFILLIAGIFGFIAMYPFAKGVKEDAMNSKNLVNNDTLSSLLSDSTLQLKAFPSDVENIDQIDAPSYTIVSKAVKQKIELVCECKDSDVDLVLLKEKLDISLENQVSSFQSGNINIVISRSYDKSSIEFLSITNTSGLDKYKYRAKMFTIFQFEKDLTHTETYVYTSNSVFNTISKLH